MTYFHLNRLGRVRPYLVRYFNRLGPVIGPLAFGRIVDNMGYNRSLSIFAVMFLRRYDPPDFGETLRITRHWAIILQIIS